jgi:menaquinone-dependent protoporphyrinogen oxidase
MRVGRSQREEGVMRVLVTAATKHGATREVAQAIGDALRGHGLDPTVVEPEQVDTVDEYDAVVLGSAVYAGHWLKPARQLVDRCGSALTARPVWLFSSGPSVTRPSPKKTPWTSPRSSLPPDRGSIGCSPASWSAGS